MHYALLEMICSNVAVANVQNYHLKSRTADIDISQYLVEVLGQIEPIDTEANGEFDSVELNKILGKELPGRSSDPRRDKFIKDILEVSRSLFGLSETKKIRIHLEVVTTDMCQFFHVDNMRQRLVCTYKGPGTEWLDDSNVVREGLGCGDNKKVVKDFGLINRANEFDVLILKGSRSSTAGVVHRSPPIEETGQTRVLLRVDEQD